ncbi:MAG: sugar phosphate nucleotidyltransferase [Ilumatobacteraceae bacterium]
MAEPKVLVIVLAGGEGCCPMPLTADQLPVNLFGGSYRIIDFVLSNFANANYRKIVVLTQYKSHSPTGTSPRRGASRRCWGTT